MRILKPAHLTGPELAAALAADGRCVVYDYCVSFLVLTHYRESAVHVLRAGQSRFWCGLPYTFLSLALGWWGVPWGVLYTPFVNVTNHRGGRDVTGQVQSPLTAASAPAAP